MSSEFFNLAILLTVKDLASGRLDSFNAKLRATGKEGEVALQTLDKIRDNLNKDLALGGIGAGSLALMSKGVKVAADYQSAMTELRSTFTQIGADGKVNFDALGKDMMRAEAIAMQLGNALPGTTQTYSAMIQTLKQNGLETETIMNGAADAVGKLAVANNEMPVAVAQNFARFGQMYKLNGEDYTKAADTFSKAYTTGGLNSSDLIGSLKYFQGRAGNALGLTGIKDAQEATKLMALLARNGPDGFQAGTSTTDFFLSYLKHGKAVEALKKDKGISLDFFDDKGKLKSFGDIIAQVEQLKKLTDKDRADYGEGIFGTEGLSAMTVMMNAGVQGWQKMNAEQTTAISLNDKIAAKQKDFNNQVEALQGTLSNLVVTVFEPMLPTLTKGAEGINTMVGYLQGFAKTNPELMKTVGYTSALVASGLVLVSGIRSATTAVQLYKLVAAVTKEDGLASMFKKTASAADGVTISTGKASTQVSSLKGKFNQFANSSALKLAVDVAQIAAAEIALKHLWDVYSEVSTRIDNLKSDEKNVTDQYDNLAGRNKQFGGVGDFGKSAGTKAELDKLAEAIFKTMKQGRSLEMSLMPERAGLFENFWTSQRPYASQWSTKVSDNWGPSFNPEIAAKQWNKGAVGLNLQDPNVLSRLILKIQSGDAKEGGANLNQQSISLLLSTLEKIAGSDKFNVAKSLADKERSNVQGMPKDVAGLFNIPLWKNQGQTLQTTTGQFGNLKQPMQATQGGFSNLLNPLNKTQQNVFGLGNSADKTQSPLSSLSQSASTASLSLDSLGNKISSWQPPTPTTYPFTYSPPSTVGGTPPTIGLGAGNAIGGTVRTKGLAYIHADEEILPANISRGYRGIDFNGILDEIDRAKKASISNSSSASFTFAPVINIPSSANSAEVKSQVTSALAEVYPMLEARLAREMRRGRERA